MNSRAVRTVGGVLFALTILAFVALPFWIVNIFDWVTRGSLSGLAAHFFIVLPFAPLLVMAILWAGFLIGWRRAKPACSLQGTDRSSKMRARLLALAGAVALAITAMVELEYPSLMGGAALGSAADESDYAVLHFYRFIETPQLFLMLLWTPFLLAAWLPRPDSPTANFRLCMPIGCFLLAVTGPVWMGYPEWVAGMSIISDTDKLMPAGVFRALETAPALFLACLWVCFFCYLGSSVRTRHALVRP